MFLLWFVNLHTWFLLAQKVNLWLFQVRFLQQNCECIDYHVMAVPSYAVLIFMNWFYQSTSRGLKVCMSHSYYRISHGVSHHKYLSWNRIPESTTNCAQWVLIKKARRGKDFFFSQGFLKKRVKDAFSWFDEGLKCSVIHQFYNSYSFFYQATR